MGRGHWHCVWGFSFAGGAHRSCELGHSSWALGRSSWALGRCLRVVRFVGGQCAWLMGVVVVGGWGVDAGGLVGCSSWAAVVVRTVSLFVAVELSFVGAGLSFVGGNTCWWAVCIVDG